MGENIRFYTRRSIRIPGYDYGQVGYYFVTVVAHQRAHLFGEIVAGEMRVNMAGRMVQYWYEKINEKFPCIEADAMVIMPNHMHFIIQIVGADPCVCPQHPNTGTRNYSSGIFSRRVTKGAHAGAPLQGVAVGDVVRWFKTMTTNQYIHYVKSGILPPFDKRIWQRNYYEHVIRNDADYDRLATYIANNTTKWSEDMFAKSQ